MKKPNKTTKAKTAGQSPALGLVHGSPEFSVGQWVFCEHRLSIIKEMDGMNVREVSDGYISHSSSSLNDRCFAIDLRGKVVSEEYERTYRKLHEKSRSLNLNFPDIHRWFVEEWAGVMQKRHDDEAVKSGYERLRAFEREILDGVERATSQIAGGVRLFR